MEDVIEIDLRKYIHAILRNIVWILVVTIAASAVTWFLTTRAPDTYSSTAFVAATNPQYSINFDPRFQTIQNSMTNYQAYVDLAKSDDVITSLYSQLDPKPAGVSSVDVFRDMLDASPGVDPSLIKLTVTSADAKTAALVANAWGSVLISRIHEVYGSQGADQIEFFSAELEKGKKQLDQAETDLVKYQGQNDMGVLTNKLNSALQSQSEYLAKKRNIDYLREDIQALLDQLKQSNGENSADLASRLNLFYLQMRMFNTQPSSPLAASIDQAGNPANLQWQSQSPGSAMQLQINVSDIDSLTSREQQVATLNGLYTILSQQAEDVDKQISGLTPTINSLQGQLAQARATLDRLTQDRDVAKETYATLARKYDEVRISAQDISNGARLAAKAIESGTPLPRQTLRNAVVAALASCFVSVLIVIAVTWYRETAVRPVIKEPEIASS